MNATLPLNHQTMKVEGQRVFEGGSTGDSNGELPG